MGSISPKNLDDYGYQIYNEYVNRYSENAIKYGQRKGLSIRYFHINIDESESFDPETALQLSYSKYKWDLYEFLPVIDMSPPTTQVYYDDNEQGTSYVTTFTLTIANLKNPLPGDIFHFYTLTGIENLDKSEMFRVQRVNYNRSLNMDKKIYQLEIKSAPYKLSTVENFDIINHYYWDSTLGDFYTEDKYDYKTYLDQNSDSIKNEINNLLLNSSLNYDSTNSGFDLCKLNTLLKTLKKYYNEDIKFIDWNQTFNYNIKEFMYLFDRYYFNKGINPITEELIEFNYVQQDDPLTETDEDITEIQINQNQFNSLEIAGTIEDTSDDIDVNTMNEDEIQSFINSPYYFKDFYCYNKKDLLYAPEYTEKPELQEKIIFEQIVDEETGDSDEVIINESEFFALYDLIYKKMFCYRELDPEFFNKLQKIQDGKFTNTSTNNYDSDSLYWSIEGEQIIPPTVIYDFINGDPYQDFYYITYQDGVQYSDSTTYDRK